MKASRWFTSRLPSSAPLVIFATGSDMALAASQPAGGARQVAAASRQRSGLPAASVIDLVKVIAGRIGRTLHDHVHKLATKIDGAAPPISFQRQYQQRPSTGSSPGRDLGRGRMRSELPANFSAPGPLHIEPPLLTCPCSLATMPKGFEFNRFKASSLKNPWAPGARFMLRAVFATAMLLLWSTHGQAAPQVEGFDLVDEVRKSRTTFEYTFVLRVNADWASYSEGSFIVSSTSAATKVTKAAVSVGALDGGQFVITSDTFKVQHDRTQPFDRGAIKFSFVGVPAPGAVWQSDSAVRVGTIRFLEERGRPLHAAAVPIQSENPTAGANLVLDSELFGVVSTASYRFIAEDGSVLREGALSSGGIPGSFSSDVQIPAQKFRIGIAAIDAVGRGVQWQSARLYAPALSKLAAVTPARVRAGTATLLKLRLTTLGRDRSYEITLRLPDGWTGAVGPWRVQTRPGVPVEISTTISVPKDAEILASQTVGVLATSAAGDRQAMNISFEVE